MPGNPRPDTARGSRAARTLRAAPAKPSPRAPSRVRIEVPRHGQPGPRIQLGIPIRAAVGSSSASLRIECVRVRVAALERPPPARALHRDTTMEYEAETNARAQESRTKPQSTGLARSPRIAADVSQRQLESSNRLVGWRRLNCGWSVMPCWAVARAERAHAARRSTRRQGGARVERAQE